MPAFDDENWRWENAVAGATAGFATVAALHPLDVVRTRFQVSDGRGSGLPLYKNTAHAVYTIARTEGLRGLYAGFYPAVFGSTISWGLYFFFYSRAKNRYLKGYDEQLGPGHHLASAAEAGALDRCFKNHFKGGRMEGTVQRDWAWTLAYPDLEAGLADPVALEPQEDFLED